MPRVSRAISAYWTYMWKVKRAESRGSAEAQPQPGVLIHLDTDVYDSTRLCKLYIYIFFLQGQRVQYLRIPWKPGPPPIQLIHKGWRCTEFGHPGALCVSSSQVDNGWHTVLVDGASGGNLWLWVFPHRQSKPNKRTLWAQNIDPAFWTCNACMHVCMIFKSAYLLIKPVNGKPKPDTLKAPWHNLDHSGTEPSWLRSQGWDPRCIEPWQTLWPLQ